jgi:hypothetical protein
MIDRQLGLVALLAQVQEYDVSRDPIARAIQHGFQQERSLLI